MPNVSELARLEDERTDLINKITDRKVPRSKSTKESLLRQLRDIELLLNIPGVPYNSSAFGGTTPEDER